VISQDLSHVQTMFPLKPGDNIAYCKPDLSDFRDTVDALLADEAGRQRMGAAARADFANWARSWREHLTAGIEDPIRGVLSTDRTRRS